MQSKAGVDNLDYKAQRTFLERLDRGELSRVEESAGRSAGAVA